MNIETKSQINSTTSASMTSVSKKQDSSGANFADELKTVKTTEETKEAEEATETKEAEKTRETEDKSVEKEKKTPQEEAGESDEENIVEVLDGLQSVVEEINKVKNPNQTDEKNEGLIKHDKLLADKDNKKEDNSLINNDMNVQEPKDQLTPQMNANMNFNSNGQPFSEFVNNQDGTKLNSSAKELEEEDAILVETVVKFDSVAMSEADVDFFVNLAENGVADMSTQETAKSAKVSKTLADLLAKSMQDNKPVRIDFDNNISVIIKISRNGKISADFLPSSQVAEAYLKENLPLLRQKFDENNIDYDELNQRKQKQDSKENDNRKKGRKDE